jgi:hypothetical protein
VWIRCTQAEAKALAVISLPHRIGSSLQGGIP